MKEFFCLFRKFFCESSQPSEGGGQNAQKKGECVGDLSQDQPHDPAQGGKVDPRAEAEGGDVEHSHPPVSAGQGEAKEDGCHSQPEQQVQAVPQPAPARPPPEETEDIIHHPRSDAQSCRLEEQDALVKALYPHQPNSRAKKLVRSPLPLSS